MADKLSSFEYSNEVQQSPGNVKKEAEVGCVNYDQLKVPTYLTL